LRALHKELAPDDVSGGETSGEYNISELLFGSEVIKEGLVKVLHNNIHDQV